MSVFTWQVTNKINEKVETLIYRLNLEETLRPIWKFVSSSLKCLLFS